jgi:hypothetical protein
MQPAAKFDLYAKQTSKNIILVWTHHIPLLYFSDSVSIVRIWLSSVWKTGTNTVCKCKSYTLILQNVSKPVILGDNGGLTHLLQNMLHMSIIHLTSWLQPPHSRITSTYLSLLSAISHNGVKDKTYGA